MMSQPKVCARVFLEMVFLCTLLNTVWAKKVEFVDPALANQIRVHTGQTHWDIQSEDLDTITVLDGRKANIRNLTGIGAMRNLRKLYLAGNQIRDILPLTTLNNLVVLDLNDNLVEELHALSTLKYGPHQNLWVKILRID